MPTYKESKTFAERRAESKEYKGKYLSTRIPVVFEPRRSEGLPQIRRRVQAVRVGTSMSGFAELIRRQLRLRRPNVINFSIPHIDVIYCDWKFEELYDNYQDGDGFLYLNYHVE